MQRIFSMLVVIVFGLLSCESTNNAASPNGADDTNPPITNDTTESTALISSYMSTQYSLYIGNADFPVTNPNMSNSYTSAANSFFQNVQTYIDYIIAYIQNVKKTKAIDVASIIQMFNQYHTKCYDKAIASDFYDIPWASSKTVMEANVKNTLNTKFASAIEQIQAL